MINMHVRPPIAPLFVPGNQPERFAKAATSDADAIIIDLEDSVDCDDKAAARKNVSNQGGSEKPVFVRINSRSSEFWSADIAAVSGAAIAGIMIPKCDGADDIRALRGALGYDLPVIALVESAAGFSNLRTLCTTPNLLCIAFGSLDYSLDVGCDPSWEALLYARSQLVLECRIGNLPPPIDGVTPILNDQETLRTNIKRAQGLGFGGSLAIHPIQTRIILDAFSPSKSEIEWAKKVVEITNSALGATKIDGTMIDRPVIERAKRILQIKHSQ